MKRLVKLSLGMILSLFAINPLIASAETFFDAYIGTAFVNVDESDIKLNGTTIYTGDESKTYIPIGLRYGIWFDNIPSLGIALDFTINCAVQDSELKPFDRIWYGSTLAMLRHPFMKTSLFPHGRLQPYLAVGPGLFITAITKVLGPPQLNDIVWFSEESMDLGLDIRVGSSWLLSNDFSLYIEYRYTQFEANFERSIADGALSFSPTLQMHYLLFGFAF